MKTGKTLLFAAVIAAISLFVMTTARAADPPTIEKGWNLISITCDVSLDDFKQRLGSDEIEVFKWDGENYVEVDRLLRGYGYVLTSNAVLSSSSICGGGAEEWTTGVEIHKGWNLIGNPYHQPIVISDLLGDNAESFSGLMYEYKGNKYRTISSGDKLRVWRAIWVYSYGDLALNYEIDCSELKISLVSPEAPELEVGETAQFKASCVVVEPESDACDCECDDKEEGSEAQEDDCGEWTGEIDVTSDVEWKNTNPVVLAGTEEAGGYEGVSLGTSDVSAALDSLESNAITVEVVGSGPRLVSIELVAQDPEIYVGETSQLVVTGTYSDESTADVTALAVFGINPEGAGAIEDAVFTGQQAGKAVITATLNGLKSEAEIEVLNPVVVLESITLTTDRRTIEIGKTANLSVTGTYSDGSTADLTDVAAITMIITGIGTLDGAVFTGVSPGDELIMAVVGELDAYTVITVIEPIPQVVSLELYGYPDIIEIYDTAVFYVYATYVDGSSGRVTSSVTWEYDTTMGRIESTGQFYPAKLGKVTVKARLGDVVSNEEEITILEKQLIWIGIHPESNNNLKPLPCPDYYGYHFCYSNNYIENGKTGKFRARADYNDRDSRTVTDEIELWESTDPAILSVTTGGYVTAHKTGLVGVRAYMEGVYSEWSMVQVIDSSTNEFLIIEMSNREFILKPGDSTEMNATYYKRASQTPVDTYKVYSNEVTDGIFTSKRVTAESDWTVVKESVGSFDSSAAEFLGISRGITDVFAEYAGLTSNSVEMEVWQPADIISCSDNPQEATWTDSKTVARLATDCDTYKTGDDVGIVFDALLSDTEGRRVLDVCLDLYIYNSDKELVKTIRHENCSPTPLFRTLEGFTPVYNFGVEWNQSNESGEQVPPGEYLAVARFYILYCPVLKVPFTITAQ